jgi:hypothetical protein
MLAAEWCWGNAALGLFHGLLSLETFPSLRSKEVTTRALIFSTIALWFILSDFLPGNPFWYVQQARFYSAALLLCWLFAIGLSHFRLPFQVRVPRKTGSKEKQRLLETVSFSGRTWATPIVRVCVPWAWVIFPALLLLAMEYDVCPMVERTYYNPEVPFAYLLSHLSALTVSLVLILAAWLVFRIMRLPHMLLLWQTLPLRPSLVVNSIFVGLVVSASLWPAFEARRHPASFFLLVAVGICVFAMVATILTFIYSSPRMHRKFPNGDPGPLEAAAWFGGPMLYVLAMVSCNLMSWHRDDLFIALALLVPLSFNFCAMHWMWRRF